MFLIFDHITGVPKLAAADDEFGSAFAESTGTALDPQDDGGEGAINQGESGDESGAGGEAATGEGDGAGDGESGTGEGADSVNEGEQSGTGEGGTGDDATPPKGDQGQAPAGDKPQQGQASAVVGDGGEPSDHGQPKHQRVDPAALQAAMQVLQQRQQASQQPQRPQQPQQQAPSQQPQGQQQQGQATDWAQYLTAEEKAALQSYDSEWQEVSQAEQIRTNAMLRQAREQILSEVQQTLAPVVEQYQQSQEAKHFGRIREAHEDFDDLTESGQLVVWATSQQNPVVRDNAIQILQQGNAEQVIGLIDLYKQAQGQQQVNTGSSTGAAPAAPASSQAPAQGSGKQQQQPRVKQKQTPSADAVAATAAVKTGSRGGDPRGADQNDFMAGFEETAKEAV